MRHTSKELVDFLFGWGNKRINREIARELRENPEGEDAQFFQAFQQRTRNALNVDWEAVRGPVFRTFKHLSAEDFMDLSSYLAKTPDDLLAETGLYVAAVHGNPLTPYLDALRDVIRGAWRQNFPGMEGSDSLRLAASLADTFVAAQLQLPFPVTLVAALLVKFGLESLFGPLENGA